LTRITASRQAADKVIFGHVAAILTAGCRMVECSRNGYSTALNGLFVATFDGHLTAILRIQGKFNIFWLSISPLYVLVIA
jgi:hypothetical protein